MIVIRAATPNHVGWFTISRWFPTNFRLCQVFSKGKLTTFELQYALFFEVSVPIL